MNSSHDGVFELRGLLPMGERGFFAAQANTMNSSVLAVRPSGEASTFAKRPQSSKKLHHPYGLVQRADGHLLVSNQKSGAVVVLHNGSGDELDVLVEDLKKLRGLAIAQDRLYVAYKKEVLVVDAQNGTVLDKIDVGCPCTGLTAVNNSLFISVLHPPSVKQYKLNDDGTAELEEVFETDKLKHPAGTAVLGDELLVLSQKTGQLLTFDIATGEYTGVKIDEFPEKKHGKKLRRPE